MCWIRTRREKTLRPSIGRSSMGESSANDHHTAGAVGARIHNKHGCVRGKILFSRYCFFSPISHPPHYTLNHAPASSCPTRPWPTFFSGRPVSFRRWSCGTLQRPDVSFRGETGLHWQHECLFYVRRIRSRVKRDLSEFSRFYRGIENVRRPGPDCRSPSNWIVSAHLRTLRYCIVRTARTSVIKNRRDDRAIMITRQRARRRRESDAAVVALIKLCVGCGRSNAVYTIT